MFENDTANTAMAQQIAEGSTTNWLSRLLEKVTGPMPIVGGPGLPGTREGVPRAGVVADDLELLRRTEHLRGKRETMMQFYARTGIGQHQIRTLSKGELTRLFEAGGNSYVVKDSPAVEMFQPRPMPTPTRFILTD